MSGQKVGDKSEVLVWPKPTVMQQILSISQPLNEITTQPDPSSANNLLWPSALINANAQAQRRHNPSSPLAIIAFCLSLILGIIIGPLQLVIMAIAMDYEWTTNVYFPSALQWTILIGGITCLIVLISLICAWFAHPQQTRLAIVLNCGTIVQLGAIWFFGERLAWPATKLTLVFTSITVVFLLLALFIRKQFTANRKNSTFGRILLILLTSIAIIEIIFSVNTFSQLASQNNSSEEIALLASRQIAARLPGVPDTLSDLAFTICNNSKYQNIFVDSERNSGLFECTENGEVYSITDQNIPVTTAVRAAATYLGTTKNPTVSLNFPTAYYLYRSIPQTSTENELTLIVPAHSAAELLDNITEPVYNYWQENHQRNLHLSIFYTADFTDITSTRDYILMAALGTMVMIDKLPNGNTLKGYFNGEITNYIFLPDTDLFALNTLGADPDLYSTAARVALTNNPHIDIHLKADEDLNAESLRTLLEHSFITGPQQTS